MARPLAFKPRLRLPEGWNEASAPAPRRRRGPPLVVLGWTASVGLCWALAAGRVPTARWLDAWLTAPARAVPAAHAAQRRATPTATARDTALATRPAAVAPAPVHASGPPPAVTALALLAAPELAFDDDAPAASPIPPAAVAPTATTSEPAADEEAASADTPAPVPLPRVEPAPTAPPEPSVSASAGVSCEAAAAAAGDEIVVGGPTGPADLPASAFSRVLDDGRWLAACGAPARTTIDVCVAVREGRVVGATVTTRPASSGLARCIAQAARRLRFQSSPRLDVARTRFAGER